jgi:hypothetical protein
MSTIADALRHIKGNLTQVLPPSLPDKICRALGQSYRHRTLTPAVTTYLFLQQILQGNPAGHELRHLSKIDFTDSAYCQARGRLTAGYFHLLMREVTGRCYGDDDFDLDPRTRWKGHRLFLIDGSTFSMPDTPALREAFGQPDAQAPGGGFPVAHLLVLFDAYHGYLLPAMPAPYRTHDMAQATLTHQALRPGDVLGKEKVSGTVFAWERKGVRNRFRLAVSSHKRFLTPFLARNGRLLTLYPLVK